MIQSTIRSVHVNKKHGIKVIREIANATKNTATAVGIEYYYYCSYLLSLLFYHISRNNQVIICITIFRCIIFYKSRNGIQKESKYY